MGRHHNYPVVRLVTAAPAFLHPHSRPQQNLGVLPQQLADSLRGVLRQGPGFGTHFNGTQSIYLISYIFYQKYSVTYFKLLE